MSKIRGDIEEAKNIQHETDAVYPETEMLKKRLEWFQDLKLGVIFHYGLYSKAGIVESWQLSEKDDWARGKPYREDFKQLQLDYWNLISEFAPEKLDADKWAAICKDAGIKYCLFTTKHHDGFNLYDTMETEYKVGGKLSPFKRDIFKEVAIAFQKAGLSMGAYYSKADWYSQYYWLDDDTVKGRGASYDTEKYPEIWDRYKHFVHNQIREITHNYGKIDFLWLDAGWSGQGKEDLDMDKIAEIAREKQPELIMVDRTMGGRHENYVTPERKVPAYDEIPTKPWESNIPIGNDWGYVPTDTFKSPQGLLESFINVVCKGGNLILGVGAKPDGTFTEEETKILGTIGQWLKVYGEGIYSTRAHPKKEETKYFNTYSKDGKNIFAFCNIHDLDEKFNVKELFGEDISKCIDLATGKEVTLQKENNNTYLLLKDVVIPEVGFIGLKGFTH